MTVTVVNRLSEAGPRPNAARGHESWVMPHRVEVDHGKIILFFASAEEPAGDEVMTEEPNFRTNRMTISRSSERL
ncbi:MAG: hypothetical protein HXX10_05710 [Rhodoplanes sp.]|uniref:hypothetical protein n=1 Tax=Rhodoplanes sp. TaxID=1968906 RepID=UPI0017B72C98|nr:hypothetical protein [Rhodoplanes sp.]NVO13516.1 hypothetical protein [Rhodoplanes sp.]